MPDKYDMTRTDSPAKYQQRYSITEDPGMANGQVLENGTSSVDKDEKGGKEKKKEEPVNMVGVFETVCGNFFNITVPGLHNIVYVIKWKTYNQSK